METKKERIAYLTGRIDGIEDFAVWKDGERYIGCMQTNIKEILKPYKDEIEKLESELK